MDTIPIIDFSPAFTDDPAAHRRLARQVADAAGSVGFFYLVHHGVASDIVDGVFEQARRFFDLPATEKDAVHLRHSNCRRGYENLGDQTLDPGARPDLKESYYCGVHFDESHRFVRAGYDSYGPNLWPRTLPDFERVMTDYIGRHIRLCERIMQIIAISLELDADHFDDSFEDPLVTLRLVRYPPHPEDADDRTFGAGAHTDWGSITTLAQDDIGGLEVQGPDGRWIAAPPVPDSFVVNLGDLMPRWTNGLFRSNAHRVVNRNSEGRHRFSIPFFYAPRFDARVEPLPTCVSADAPARYAACTVGEHISEMVRLTYGAG